MRAFHCKSFLVRQGSARLCGIIMLAHAHKQSHFRTPAIFTDAHRRCVCAYVCMYVSMYVCIYFFLEGFFCCIWSLGRFGRGSAGAGSSFRRSRLGSCRGLHLAQIHLASLRSLRLLGCLPVGWVSWPLQSCVPLPALRVAWRSAAFWVGALPLTLERLCQVVLLQLCDLRFVTEVCF